MELEVWSGDWGLPSIDISCLQVMVYCNFSGVSFTTNIRNNPSRRNLPTFKHRNVSHCDLENVILYLQRENYNADHFLSSRHKSEIEAYSKLLKEKLYPGLQFIWWIDNNNYVKLTRPWYAKKLPFPFNFYYPTHYKNKARDLISTLYGSFEDNFASVENKVYSAAEKCLTLLSNKLGDSKYFLGNQPSSLDAIIFSYLAPLLKAPFPNPALQNHLKACENLVNFVEMILQKYYSPLIKEYRKKEIALEKAEAEKISYKSRNQILAASIAFIAMFGYIAIAPTFSRRSITFQKLFFETEEEGDYFFSYENVETW